MLLEAGLRRQESIELAPLIRSLERLLDDRRGLREQALDEGQEVPPQPPRIDHDVAHLLFVTPEQHGEFERLPVVDGLQLREVGLIAKTAGYDVSIYYSNASSPPSNKGDWTLAGGGVPVAFGNTKAATTSYRNHVSGGFQTVKTYVFSAQASLQAGKKVVSVTLPNNQNVVTLAMTLMAPPTRLRPVKK